MKSFLSKHKWKLLLAFIIFIVAIPFGINSLFKLTSPLDIFVAEWEAGDALAFYGVMLASATTIIGVYISIEYAQRNYRVDEVNRVKPYARQSVDAIFSKLEPKMGRKSVQIIFNKDEGTMRSVWANARYDSSEYGTKLLDKLFGGAPFTFPKSLYAVLDCIKAATKEDKNAIIMDFFSGSATTAHAVMQLNAEDGGHRKSIMVQLPEDLDEAIRRASDAKTKDSIKKAIKFLDSIGKVHTICEIGKERIRRAGDKIKSESSMTTQDLDVGFRVLKLDDTNMKDVYYAPDDYDQGMLAGLESNIKDDRTDLDLLFGCLIDWGLPLSLPYKSEQLGGCTVHTYNDGDLIACFDANIPESVVKEIAQRKPLRAVFRDSGFASSPEKINVFEIFKLYMPEDADDISKRVRVI